MSDCPQGTKPAFLWNGPYHKKEMCIEQTIIGRYVLPWPLPEEASFERVSNSDKRSVKLAVYKQVTPKDWDFLRSE